MISFVISPHLTFISTFIALSETWLKEKNDVSSSSLDNYHEPIILNRPNEDGGCGIALYIHNNYTYRVQNDLTHNSNDSQFLFAEIVKYNISTLIGVSYKPPNVNIDSYSLILSNLLDKLENTSKNIFIAGDFNIDLLKSENNEETNSFFNNLLTYSLFPTIVKPTRITSHSATLIDNIFTNSLTWLTLSNLVFCTMIFRTTFLSLLSNMEQNY